jgi:nucleotide-binding universal stress UspA family protein
MKILYATDGSEGAAVAGRLLEALPLAPDTHVTVLSAIPESGWVDVPPLTTEGSVYSLLAEVRASEQALALRAAETDAAPFRERGLSVTVSVRRQSAVPAILEQAEEDRTELIVVGSHGMGRVEHFLVGSVSERVARHAPCSVLVARKDTVRRAVLGVDSSEASEHALEALLRLPLPKELELTAIHVIRPRDVMPPVELGIGPSWEAAMEQYEEQLRGVGLRVTRHAQERLRGAGLRSEVSVRCGGPAEELIAAAHETAADLIVVGAANKSALGRLFLGSVSARVLGHAPCSVLAARSPVLAAQEERAARSPGHLAPQPVAG